MGWSAGKTRQKGTIFKRLIDNKHTPGKMPVLSPDTHFVLARLITINSSAPYLVLFILTKTGSITKGPFSYKGCLSPNLKIMAKNLTQWPMYQFCVIIALVR